jgi:flagellum-specific ATP synthase
MSERIVRLREYLANCRRAVNWATPITVTGRLTRVSGLVMEAVGVRLPVGSQCHIQVPGGQSIEAEVAGFSGERLFIMPATDTYGVMPGARVVPDNPMVAQPPRLGTRYVPRRRAHDRVRHVPVGERLLGRVLDGAGRPLDGLGPLALERRVPLYSRPINPLERAPIRQTLDVGVRAINGLLTVGRGQRLGLFAGSGVGKSVLLGMMARYTEADVVVVGLIGERGREVKEFIDQILGAEGHGARGGGGRARRPSAADAPERRSVCDVDRRIFSRPGQARALDHGFADPLRDGAARGCAGDRRAAGHQGLSAVGVRQAAAAGERAGNGRSGSGSVTAFFTVLMEGDDQQDPIADAARAILDGHIVLTRDLADAGHYPAIDIEASISRAQPDLLSDDALERTRRFKYLYSRYMRSRDLLAVGAYVPGADVVLDEGVRLYPRMQGYLMQGMRERATLESSRAELDEVLG